jgi:hypothetical protein
LSLPLLEKAFLPFVVSPLQLKGYIHLVLTFLIFTIKNATLLQQICVIANIAIKTLDLGTQTTITNIFSKKINK